MKKILVHLESSQLCDIVEPGAEFSVASGLQWFDAPDEVAHDTHEFNGTAVVPKPPKPINQVKAEKLAQLERARKAAEVAQVTVQGKPFPATEEFQAKISRALNYIGRGKPLNLGGAWRDSNAQSVNMNNALLGQLEDAITAQGVAAWAKYWTKFDAVMAAATVDDVNAVEW
jgi:hypothetical protein